MIHINFEYNTMLLTIILLLLSQQQYTTIWASPIANSYYENKCTDKETGREFYIGETFNRPGRCIKVQCLGTLELWEDRCSQPKLSGDCSVLPPANEFLHYPKCCPLYQCRVFHRNEYGIAIEITTYDHFGIMRKSQIDQEFTIANLPRYPNNSTNPHVKF